MDNGSPDRIVTDPEVFIQLSAEQQAVTVLRHWGSTPEETEILMSRFTPLGVMVNNLKTCRSKLHQEQCACESVRAQVEAQLTKYRPKQARHGWTPMDVMGIIIALPKSRTIPNKLRQVFKPHSAFQTDLV